MQVENDNAALPQTVHIYANISERNTDSAVNPHNLDLVSVITPDSIEHTPSGPVTVGSRINLTIIEDAVSPTDNAFPVSYYAFQGWVIGTQRVGRCDVDFIAFGQWRGELEIAILTTPVAFIDSNSLPSLQSVGNTQDKWVSRSRQRTYFEYLERAVNKYRHHPITNARLLALETAIEHHRNRACMYGPDWSRFFGYGKK